MGISNLSNFWYKTLSSPRYSPLKLKMLQNYGGPSEWVGGGGILSLVRPSERVPLILGRWVTGPPNFGPISDGSPLILGRWVSGLGEALRLPAYDIY